MTGAAILGVLLVAAFALAPVKFQGRIIETVTFSDWPMEWVAKRRFHYVEKELAQILQFLDENPEVRTLSESPMGLVAAVAELPLSPYEFEDPDVLRAIRVIEAEWVTAYDDQVHVVLGNGQHRGTYTGVAYTFPRVDDYGVAMCPEISRQQRQSSGVCAFSLSDRWLLTYQWFAY